MSPGQPNYPLATIAAYGPTNLQATKLVVAIFPQPQQEPSALRKWTVPSGEIRADQAITQEVVAFLKQNNVAHTVSPDRILGCPHEEGIDYLPGGPCPFCPFWAGRNRFTHQPEAKIGRNDPCPCGSGKKFKKCCGAP